MSFKEVNAMVDRGIAQVHTNLDESDSVANIVYYHSIALQNDSLMAKTYALMGYVRYYRGDYSMSSEYYKKALESVYYRDKLDRRQALLNNLGVNYEFQHRYGEADQAYLQSLQIARKLGDSVSVHESYINLGLLNALLAKYGQAEAYLETALVIRHATLVHRSPKGDYPVWNGRRLSPGQYLVRITREGRLLETIRLIHK